MLGSVLQYVLGIVFGFFGALLLLRAWLYYWALSPRHPLCELTRKITDWASVVAAFFPPIFAVLLHRTLGHLPATPVGLLIAPFAMLLRWALEMISWGAIIWAVLSWVNRGHPMTYTLEMLLNPFLAPIRRILPTFRGIDFSPLVLIVITNVLLMLVVPLSRGFILL